MPSRMPQYAQAQCCAIRMLQCAQAQCCAIQDAAVRPSAMQAVLTCGVGPLLLVSQWCMKLMVWYVCLHVHVHNMCCFRLYVYVAGADVEAERGQRL